MGISLYCLSHNPAALVATGWSSVVLRDEVVITSMPLSDRILVRRATMKGDPHIGPHMFSSSWFAR